MTVVFALAMLGLSAFRDKPDVDWAITLLESSAAKISLRKYQLSRSKQLFPPKSATNSGSPTEVRRRDELPSQDGVLSERLLFVGKVLKGAGDLISISRNDEAYRLLVSARLTRPDLSDALDRRFIGCAILTGHFEEAYTQLVGLLTGPVQANEYLYLQLSLVTAARGEIYPGQLAFCCDWLKTYCSALSIRNYPDPIKSRRDPHSLMVISSLALGMKGSVMSPAFLEMCLSLEPKCELAAQRLIEVYGFQGRNSDVCRVASTIADHLPAGEARDKFLTRADVAAKLKDTVSPNSIKP